RLTAGSLDLAGEQPPGDADAAEDVRRADLAEADRPVGVIAEHAGVVAPTQGDHVAPIAEVVEARPLNAGLANAGRGRLRSPLAGPGLAGPPAGSLGWGEAERL